MHATSLVRLQIAVMRPSAPQLFFGRHSKFTSGAARCFWEPGFRSCLVDSERYLCRLVEIPAWRAVRKTLLRVSSREKPANCPHKLTKAAEPWLGGGAAFGQLQLHARVTPAADRSCRCALVVAAAVPLSGRGHGWRPLQLRVITLAGSPDSNIGLSSSPCRSVLVGFPRQAVPRR